MYIFGQGGFPCGPGNLWYWETCHHWDKPTPWAGAAYVFITGLLTGGRGGKIPISEPVGLPCSMTLCPEL